MATNYTAGQAECLVFSFREGLIQKLAHDLKLRVEKLSVVVDGEQSVRATFDASSVVVVCARKDGVDAPSTLSESDRKTIDASTRNEVLEVSRYPEITFASTRITKSGDGYAVDGDLTIKATTKPITLAARREGAKLVGTFEFDQRDFGVKPFSAMLGTLRIAPVLKVQIEIPAP